MKTFIIFLITGILCTHCTQKYIKMDKDKGKLHATGNWATKPTEGDTPPETASPPAGAASSTLAETADLKKEDWVKMLFRTIADENIEGFKKVLEEAKKMGIAKEVVNSVHDKDLGNTPLMSVSGAGYVEMMQLLLAAGAEVNMVEEGKLSDRWTALHHAAFEGRRDAVELLLESGANKDAPSEDKRAPLHYAASQGHLETVKLLVEKGAKIEAASEDGSTALLFAVWYGHLDIVVFLLEEGANIEVRDEDGDGVQEQLKGIKNIKQKEAMKELLDRYKNKK